MGRVTRGVRRRRGSLRARVVCLRGTVGLPRGQRVDRAPQPLLPGGVAAADEPAHRRLRPGERSALHAAAARRVLDPGPLSADDADLRPMESLVGQFLIASPSILDPNFHRTVVFITAHTDEGAVGLILNRRSEATVAEAVPQLAPVSDLADPIFVGGPVNPEGVAVLAEFDDPDEAGVVVLDDVGFVALDDALEEGPPELHRTRVFAGVAGWGPEQLDAELERDDWIIERADPDDIFTDDPEQLWSHVLRRKGGSY